MNRTFWSSETVRSNSLGLRPTKTFLAVIFALALLLTVDKVHAVIVPTQSQLLVVSHDTNEVLKYDTNGDSLGLFAATAANPNVIKIGPDGSVYVSNWGDDFSASASGSVQRFDASGNPIAGGTFFTNTGNGSIMGLAFTPDNFLYYSTPNSIRRVNATTGAIDSLVITGFGPGGDSVRQIEVVPDTDLINNPAGYRIAFVSNDMIASLNPNAGDNTAILDSQIFYANTPGFGLGLTLRADGDLFYTAAGPNEVRKTHSVDPTTFSLFAASGSATPPLTSPYGLLFDTNGNVLVGSIETNTVAQYSPTGTFLGNFVTAGLGGVSGPQGLAFLPVPEPNCCVLAALGIALVVRGRRQIRYLRK